MRSMSSGESCRLARTIDWEMFEVLCFSSEYEIWKIIIESLFDDNGNNCRYGVPFTWAVPVLNHPNLSISIWYPTLWQRQCTGRKNCWTMDFALCIIAVIWISSSLIRYQKTRISTWSGKVRRNIGQHVANLLSWIPKWLGNCDDYALITKKK